MPGPILPQERSPTKNSQPHMGQHVALGGATGWLPVRLNLDSDTVALYKER